MQKSTISQKPFILRLTAPLLFFIADAMCTTAFAQQKPLWELHAGLGTLHIAHYRGSDSRHHYTAPLPGLVYRGEYVKVSEDGVKGLLLTMERLKLDISLAASLPASSNKNDARAGMPKLEPTVEIGPSLIAEVWRSTQTQSGVWLNLPLRTTFSFDDFNIHDQGLVFSPYLQWRHKQKPWSFNVAYGLTYGDENYHNYFYEVDKRYVTDQREEYHPSGGYSGQRFTISLSKQFKESWLATFIRYDDLKNTAFIDSPLVERDNHLAFGLVYMHVLFKSATLSSHSEHIDNNL